MPEMAERENKALLVVVYYPNDNLARENVTKLVAKTEGASFTEYGDLLFLRVK